MVLRRKSPWIKWEISPEQSRNCSEKKQIEIQEKRKYPGRDTSSFHNAPCGARFWGGPQIRPGGGKDTAYDKSVRCETESEGSRMSNL